MTKTFLAFMGAAVVFTACEQKKPAAEIAPPVAPSVESEQALSAPPAPSKPAPTPEPVAVALPPAKPTIGSIVWAVTRLSITTDDGIMGVAPGSKLRVVKETDSGYTVTDEKHEFQVLAAQISMNNGAASAALAADAAARAATAAQPRSTSGGTNPAYLNQMIGEMQNRYDQLAREEAGLKASLQRANIEDVQASQAAAQRRVYTRTINPGQVSAWRARLPIVQVE
jgi:hypothetical protein